MLHSKSDRLLMLTIRTMYHLYYVVGYQPGVCYCMYNAYNAKGGPATKFVASHPAHKIGPAY